MLSRTYKVQELAEILKADQSADKKIASGIIDRMATDSRNKGLGPSTCFFAIKGSRFDGHSFINDAYAAGVRCFVTGANYTNDKLAGSAILRIDDTLNALQALAAFHRNELQYPVAAITGSNGKTVVKEWLYQVLSSKMRTARSPKSYNSQIGVPLSVLGLPVKADIGIIEAGISLEGEMAKLEAIIKPDLGILTNIHRAHRENFKSTIHLVKEKLQLFRNCKVLIYRKDYEDVHRILKEDKAYAGLRLLSWSVRPKSGADIEVEFRQEVKRTHITIRWKNETGEFTIPFINAGSLENATHCIITARHLGMDLDSIAAAVNTLPSVAMRLQQIQGVNNCTIVNDTYNSDLTSLEIALNFLNIQRQHGKKTLILSDIFQSGMGDAELYGKVNELCTDNDIERLIGVGPALVASSKLFTIPVTVFSATDELLDKLSGIPFYDESILIKGSRNFGFERISARLELKKHETTLEVNLSAVIDNLNFIKSKLNPNTRIMAMVKAYSYGTGSNEIANVLEHHGVSHLAVAYIDEGIALRKRGIDSPVMVMNPSFGELPELSRYRLDPEVFCLDDLSFICAFSSRASRSFTIHLKVESGMHRLGFELEDIPGVIRLLKENPQVRLASVFTHLAGTDKASLDDFTRRQVKDYLEFCQRLSGGGVSGYLKHVLNSDGILRFPEFQFDMVRLGIGLYGITSLEEYRDSFRSVLTLKTRISQLKHLRKGESVGYGRNFVAHRDMRIATVAIGYADGFPRSLGNGNWHFVVQGQPASVLGNVCMDMTMIDVSHVENVREKDEVIVLADNSDIYTMAAKRQTIPYEVLTSVSERVKRVYYYGD